MRHGGDIVRDVSIKVFLVGRGAGIVRARRKKERFVCAVGRVLRARLRRYRTRCEYKCVAGC